MPLSLSLTDQEVTDIINDEMRLILTILAMAQTKTRIAATAQRDETRPKAAVRQHVRAMITERFQATMRDESASSAGVLAKLDNPAVKAAVLDSLATLIGVKRADGQTDGDFKEAVRAGADLYQQSLHKELTDDLIACVDSMLASKTHLGKIRAAVLADIMDPAEVAVGDVVPRGSVARGE